MAEIKHIIFDNDGVLVDSEHIAMKIMDNWGYAFVKNYEPVANIQHDYIYHSFAGISTNEIVRHLIRHFSLPISKIRDDFGISSTNLEEISTYLAEIINTVTIKEFRKQLKSIPGVTKIVKHLKEKYDISLLTTSPKNRMDTSLSCAVDPQSGQNAHLSELFPPGPLRRSAYGLANKYDEFFHAIGWDPRECVVIEDSLSGVEKARSAGAKRGVDLRVVGTVAARFYEDKKSQARALVKAGAELVISTVADLPKALAWLDFDFLPSSKPDFELAVYGPR